jgi:putative endonuclease
MTTTRQKGSEAEQAACSFLVKEGYEIVDCNWYNNHHEIDIVARKNGIVAFVEVKSLFSDRFREPYQQVNLQKQRSLIMAANAYIRKQNIMEEVRFDIVSIITGKGEPKIEHIENAFYPRVR